jgi:hypothetical protein
MEFNSTCPLALLCDDSELSITASVTGTLTFLYAIAITVYYRTAELGNSKEDIHRFHSNIASEALEVRLLWIRLKDLSEDHDMAPEYKERIEILAREASTIFNEAESLVLPFEHASNARKWKIMLERGRFISRKAKVHKYQDDIIRVRTRLAALSDQFQSR